MSLGPCLPIWHVFGTILGDLAPFWAPKTPIFPYTVDHYLEVIEGRFGEEPAVDVWKSRKKREAVNRECSSLMCFFWGGEGVVVPTWAYLGEVGTFGGMKAPVWGMIWEFGMHFGHHIPKIGVLGAILGYYLLKPATRNALPL